MLREFSELDLRKVGHTIQLVGAVWAGEGKEYVLCFPERQDDEYDVTERVRLATRHEDWKALLYQSDSLATEVLVEGENGELQKTVLRKCERQISQQVSWNVFRRDGFRCRYCGNETVPLTVDHVVLWEDGGPSIEANLVAACRHCNKVRGRTPYPDWLRHPHYLKVYKRLSPEARYQNEQALERISSIPLVKHPRGR